MTSARTTRILMCVLLSLLACTAPALAGVGKRNGEIGFDFGWAGFDSDLTDDSGGRFTIRGGFHFSDWFQLEAEDIGMGADNIGGTSTDLIVGAFFINGVFNFHPGEGNTVVPYVLAGVGLATTRFDFGGGGREDDTGGASQFAAGSRFFFGKTKRAAVRIEVSMLRHETSNLFIEGTFTDEAATVGFTWRLGTGK